MELPAEIVSKIMTYHSNIRFDKGELLDYVWVYQKFYECIYCELHNYNKALLMILDLDERIGELFFKWVVKRIAPELDWDELYHWENLYHEHYYERTPGEVPILIALDPLYNDSLDFYMDETYDAFDVTIYLNIRI